MNALIEAVLLWGLAAGPDELRSLVPDRAPDPVRGEALADLERRVGREAARAGVKRPPQEDPTPQRPTEPVPAPVEEAGTPWIDFDWLELGVRVGMAIFSDEFHIDPSPAFVIEGRAPLPWLSPSSNPDGDFFGAFAQLSFAVIERTIEPEVDKPSGAAIMLTLGVDYSILRNTTWMILVRAGFVYATYGGVTDLEDGMGLMGGLTVGLTVSRSVSITLAPEYVFGDGDNVMMGTVGVSIGF